MELIKIAEAPIIMDGAKFGANEDGDLVIQGFEAGEEIAPDKLTRAAQAKKICIVDASEILDRIDVMEANLKSLEEGAVVTRSTPESRARKNK